MSHLSRLQSFSVFPYRVLYNMVRSPWDNAVLKRIVQSDKSLTDTEGTVNLIYIQFLEYTCLLYITVDAFIILVTFCTIL